MGQADYALPNYISALNLGDVWMDSITIPLNSINDEVTGLAIGVYDLSLGGLLVTDHKNTDWNGRRLIFDIEKCQNHNTTRSGLGQDRL